MAEVKMELSEFQRMEQTEKDLRDQIKQNEELSAKIEKLQKEKIQALEDAKHKVVITKRSIVKEHSIMQRKPHEFLKELFQALHLPHEVLNYAYKWSTAREALDGENSYINLLIEKAFGKVRSVEVPTGEPEVEIIGLDDYKAEFKKEYLKKLEGITQDKLDNLEKLSEENKRLEEQLKDARDELDVAGQLNTQLGQTREKYHNDVRELNIKNKFLAYQMEVIKDLVEEISFINFRSTAKAILERVTKKLDFRKVNLSEYDIHGNYTPDKLKSQFGRPSIDDSVYQ
jgi:hypothetical protein